MSGSPVPDVTPDLPGLHWRGTLALLQRLPQGALSRAFGTLADLYLPRPMRAPVLGAFARAVGIDVAEAELPLTEYDSLNRFFVRRLLPGARTWPDDPCIAGSPVDGVLGQCGPIRDGTLVQAKGRHYRAGELLGSETAAQRYDGGVFLTIYLSPRHYHRIHAPCDGVIEEARYVPGALLPVNAPAVLHIDRLFPRNERLLCTIEGTLGSVAVVAIGAYNVGRISATFDPEWNENAGGWVTNHGAHDVVHRHYDPAPLIERGAELMAFHLGSTVVLLFEPDIELMAGESGAGVRLGEPIAQRAR
jgi:phosphatidylserine decarboxylase